jgi:uncharacterized repeat protein (TIGR02543 family)
MSYRLRVYGPVDSSYSQILLLNGNVYLDRVSPAGESSPCYDGYVDGFSVNIQPTFNTEAEFNNFASVFSRWVVNADGQTSYQTPTVSDGYRCQLDWTRFAGAANVYVRLEIATAQTYYAQLAYNANGGTGAPATQSGAKQNTNPYVDFVIPYTTPTRPGYVFGGWTLDGMTGTIYPAGATISVYGYNYSPGPTHTLYAVWTEDTSGSVWLSPSGIGYNRGIVWLYANYWRKGIPWICTGGTTWKRGV